MTRIRYRPYSGIKISLNTVLELPRNAPINLSQWVFFQDTSATISLVLS